MAELNKAGDLNSLGHLDIPQGQFREQVDVIADELRQLAGNADVPEDPLNAPYTLYVNPYTGNDTFVGGQYSTSAELERRISNQRLECGYTEARPFKTVNRAALEAAIITSRDYLDEDAKAKALVSIVLSSGEHIVDNSEGKAFSASNFPAVSDGTELTIDELATFNDQNKGAVILPRGCSVISLDLRKTIIRPASVPSFDDENANYGNRRSIFKVTGAGYYYGITFKDSPTVEESHHLLHCFEFASETELNRLYQKVLASFAAADISAQNTVASNTEFEIVGPKPDVPSDPTDTVGSASPYIYNCSIRSIYGLGGIFANGDVVDGFRSMVVAQFTGVSLQRDMRCWEEYTGGNWQALSPGAYDRYIRLDPNDVRMAIKKRSFHVRAVNDAVIQEVSCFAIGQGCHHFAESGGELTVTNSNSNFGGVAAIADGFRRKAQVFDSDYQVREVRTAVDPLTLGSQIAEFTLGFVDTVNGSNTVITLQQDLVPGRRNSDQPEILDSKGYSLKEGDFVWIDNPNGADYRAKLVKDPYNGSNTITVESPGFRTSNGGTPDSSADETDFALYPALPNLRVYVRRFQDVRTVEQRRFSLRVYGPAGNRLPVRDYVLQPSGGGNWNSRISSIRGSELIDFPNSGSNDVRIELTYAKRPKNEAAFNGNKFYRKGDTVRKDNKHYVARVNVLGKEAVFERDFAENYVHMGEDYAPEGNYRNAQPILIFDKDTQENATLGNKISDSDIVAQIESAVDYIATFQQLQNFGANPSTLLALTDEDNRDTNVVSESYQFELRRPTNIRLFGHAWEWAGYLNYTKALPDYQRTLTPENKFTYYFTNESGGKVFCNGFNEEGLQVSPRGLEDVTTGEVLSADNLTSPDREINPQTEFEDIKITNLEVVSYKDNSKKADKPDDAYGIVRLSNLTEREGYDKDVLTFKDAEERYTRSQPRNLPFQILHVVPDDNPLTGIDSIPYGFPDDKELGFNPDPDDPDSGDKSYDSVSQALQEAAAIFVPSGSAILISVHGSRTGSNKVEDGPLQLANSFAQVIVAGARGASSAPTIYVKRGTTKNALGRTPQYSSEYAFSAGIIFADVILDCDCSDQVNTIATINGGFGVGKFDTGVIWSNCRNVAACATTYGQQTFFQYYNRENTTRTFTQTVASSAVDNFDVQFFGAVGGSGLVSQGCDLVLDFRNPNTGRTNEPQCKFRYVNNANRIPRIQFFDAGGRGGVKTGGRVAPIVDLDFSGHRFDLRRFVGENFTSNQNYCGKTFKIRPVASGSNPRSQYNIEPDTFDELIAFGSPDDSDDGKGVILRNGCCVDINSGGTKQCGPFGFYLEVEEWQRDQPPEENNKDFRLLRHDTNTNSYIYGSSGRAI